MVEFNGLKASSPSWGRSQPRSSFPASLDPTTRIGRRRSPISPLALGSLLAGTIALTSGWIGDAVAQEADSPTAPPESVDSNPNPNAEPPITPLDLSDLPEPDLPRLPAASTPPPSPSRPDVIFQNPTSPTSPTNPSRAISPSATNGAIVPQSPVTVRLEPPTSAPPPSSTPPGLSPSDAGLLVLSERSTGCEATIQLGGDIPAGLCGYGPGQLGSSGSGFAGLPGMPPSPSGVAVNSLGFLPGPSTQVADYYARSAQPLARLGNGDRSLIFPLAGLVSLTSSFGWRLHPLFGDWRLHTGADFGADWGTPVYAVASGQVTIADFLGGYGLTVVLRREDGSEEVLYGHLSEIFVQPGTWVEQGTAIGRVGSTGNSTGPHLHLELRQLTADGWIAIDPQPYLQGSPAPGAIAGGSQPETAWDLQLLGAGFMDPTTPLEQMVTWLVTTLIQLGSSSSQSS
ncbi:M23 family metallopeptidase [Prochlorothrix hollandica]|uniref:M23 family metallopeptidase n=1 Tax=Prochlorothrix hollandica TaxID=1223 RepID=UPI0009DA9AC9|nr:M23 family metallopeptidase [Prochlorothrix hollandica]